MGRPRGPSGNSLIAKFRAYIGPHWNQIQDAAIKKAKEGDVKVYAEMLSRMAPNEKPQAELVRIPKIIAATTLQGKMDAAMALTP